VKALELRGISRVWGDCVANRDVDLDVDVGTVHAVVGENGAGKSTLLNIAAGVTPASAGTVRILGESLSGPDPREAIRLGLGMVHQHFMLVEPFTVAENLVLGHEPVRGLALDMQAARAAVARLSAEWGLGVDPDARVEALSVGEKQRVEILRVLYQGAKVLVLDEPTAVLSPPEVTRLLAMLRRFVAADRTVVLVTHKLDEVMAVADRVTVMRRGQKVADVARAETSPAALAHLIVGREVATEVPGERAVVATEPRLVVEGLTLREGERAVLDGVSLGVRPGEILGVAGVIGNGQTELVEVLAGIRAGQGRITLDGRDLAPLSVAERIAAGIAHIPEDRNDRGLVLDLSLEENLVAGALERFGSWWALDRGKMRRHAEALLARFDVRPPAPEGSARSLSGGNAQKVVVARETTRGADETPRLLLVAQPTRGVDIGAVEAIHARLRDLRDRGVAILLVSSELSELRALSDRIVVMQRGRIVAELAREDATQERLGEHMTGAA
jgi:simple sugar transport system ATP-binding protein